MCYPKTGFPIIIQSKHIHSMYNSSINEKQIKRILFDMNKRSNKQINMTFVDFLFMFANLYLNGQSICNGQ